MAYKYEYIGDAPQVSMVLNQEFSKGDIVESEEPISNPLFVLIPEASKKKPKEDVVE